LTIEDTYEDTMDNKEHHQVSSGSAGGSENSKHSPALNATVIHWNNLRQAFNHKIHNLNPTWTLTVSFTFFQKDSFFKNNHFNEFKINFKSKAFTSKAFTNRSHSCSLKKFKYNAFTSKYFTLFTLNPTWTLTIALKIFKKPVSLSSLHSNVFQKWYICSTFYYEFLNHVWWLLILV